MPTSPLQSLLAGTPPPDPLDFREGMDLAAYCREQALFNRKLLDYTRRLMQKITGPNIVNELVVQNIVVNILNDLLTTKGDLLSHTGSASVRLPVGATNGHVLTVDSGQSTGLKWDAVTASGGAMIDSISAQSTLNPSSNETIGEFGETLSLGTALNTAGKLIWVRASGTCDGYGSSGTYRAPEIGITLGAGSFPVTIPGLHNTDNSMEMFWSIDTLMLTRTASSSGSVLLDQSCKGHRDGYSSMSGGLWKDGASILHGTSSWHDIQSYSVNTTTSKTLYVRITDIPGAGTGHVWTLENFFAFALN